MLATRGLCSTTSWLLLTVTMVCMLSYTSACFIRNCPIGGKRSGNMGQVTPHKQCMRCGPGGMGQCVGPNICCGRTIGCFMDTEETSVCGHENDSPVPCAIEAPSCGMEEGSICAANGLCCNDEKCEYNSECEMGENFINKKRLSSQDALLHYVRQIMAAKGYPERR